jgi:hypothetical protein
MFSYISLFHALGAPLRVDLLFKPVVLEKRDGRMSLDLL